MGRRGEKVGLGKGKTEGGKEDIWQHKTRIPGLSCGVVTVILLLCLAVLVEHRLFVSDSQTQLRLPPATTVT